MKELTWQDIRKIVEIADHTALLTKGGECRKQEDYYKEVLKRYNDDNKTSN